MTHSFVEKTIDTHNERYLVVKKDISFAERTFNTHSETYLEP